MSETIDVGLAGCGRWGRRLLAALEAHPRLRVRAVADADPRARGLARALAPHAYVVASIDEALPHVAAMVIATPSHHHAAHARAALAAGRDVFVEKPLALCRRDAEAVVELADAKARIGMVGHILRFDERVERFVRAAKSGRVGPLREVRARRLTTSGSPAPLWTLAPHDVATLLAIDGGPVADVKASAADGATRLTLTFASGLHARIEVDTRADAPCRQTRARGSDGLLVLDELRSPPGRDALGRELDHFVDCVTSRRSPRSSLAEGLAVVEVLERAQIASTPSIAASR